MIDYDHDLVSIIMPAYNASKYIQESLSCVFEQTYTNWEAIVVDDCSTDNTCDVVEQYAKRDLHNRIRLTRNYDNKGVAHARNTALSAAKGKYIAFLDSDDLWLKNKLQKQLTFMKENNYAFSFTSYYCMNEAGSFNKNVIFAPTVVNQVEILKNTIIGCSTVVINREMVGEIKMPILQHAEDTFTWHDIMNRGYSAYGLQDPLTRYRISSNSLTGSKAKVARMYWRNLRDYASFNMFRASYIFMAYAINALKKTF